MGWLLCLFGFHKRDRNEAAWGPDCVIRFYCARCLRYLGSGSAGELSDELRFDYYEDLALLHEKAA